MQLRNKLKIFISSPGDCNKERNLIRYLATNDPTVKAVCEASNYRIDVRSREDIHSDVGRPQSLINDEIIKYKPDLIIFIFWSRIGSDAGNGWTGTEEEWELALKLNQQGNCRPRVSLFLNKDDIPSLQYDQEQVNKLNQFINRVFSNYEALAKTYDGTIEFEKLIRSYLVDHILNHTDNCSGYDQYRNQLLVSSEELLKWQSCLKNGNYIKRKEIKQLVEKICNERDSIQLILGPKGTGKSSLLSVLGKKLVKEGLTVLCIKSDSLPTDIDSIEKFSHDYLNIDINLTELIRTIALDQKVVIIIDQLDALSELTDQKTNRLNMLLNFMRTLCDVPNVHVIASCRDFEYRHDPRLSNINADPIYLELPTWEEVEHNVQELGFDTPNFSSSTKELLRTPLHLNLFMDVALPKEVYDSLHGLLQGLWNREVENRDSSKKIEILEKVALYMSEEEVFWVPLSMFDGYGRIKDDLLSSDILVLSEKERTIGFRHQTYLDFVLTKIFAKKELKLSNYILENQDSLFIRGTVINTLNYMRSAAPMTYAQEIICLFRTRPRKHLWILLLEFIGAQLEPLAVEKELLELVLVTDSEGPVVLRAISNSPALVNFFLVRKSFTDWLKKIPEKSKYSLPVLSKAAEMGNLQLTKLITTTWFNDLQMYGQLIWVVLSDYRVWDSDALLIVEQLAVNINSYYINHVLESISRSEKKKAIIIYEKILKKKFDEAIKNSLVANENQDTNEDSFFSNSRRSFEVLLTESIFSSVDIVSLAEGEPEFFLNQLWSLYIKILDKVAYDHHEWLEEYRDDAIDHYIFDEREFYKHSFGEGILSAITMLATTYPEKYLMFVSMYEKEEFLLVHQFLAAGFIELDTQYSKYILNYLRKDVRRLNLEKSRSGHYFTKKLISKIYVDLSSDDKQFLEDYILGYNRYKKSLPDWDISDRRNRIRWNREHRLYLLRGMPTNLISESLKKLINEEERALNFPQENDGEIIGGFIGARITLDEMNLAKDKDILRLFNKQTDDYNEENPALRYIKKDFSRSGGTRELGNIFREFSKVNSKRSIYVLKQLTRTNHQIYAGSGFEGLSDSDISNDQLLIVLNELIETGFGNSGFIERATSGLENRARRNGLSEGFIKILKKWLENLDETQQDHYQVTNKDDRNGSLFFGHGGSYILPGERASLLRTIAFGYLARKRPAISKYLSFISKLLRKENHSVVLSTSISFIQYCLGNNQATKAMELFNKIINHKPEVFLYEETLHSLAPILRMKDQTSIQQECLFCIKSLNISITDQAFGELLLAYYYFHKTQWAKEEIINILAINNSKAQLGLTYAAAGLWNYFSEKSLLLEIFTTTLNIENEHVHRAIGSIFYEVHEAEMDGQLESLMLKISCYPLVLERVAEPLIAYLANIVNDYPDLAYLIAKNLLDYTGEKVVDISSALALVTDDLTSISISLQRNMLHRNKGIELFEMLLSLNAREAKEALELLERLPISNTKGASRYRPRRRRKKKML